MLYRKIQKKIENHLLTSDKILMLEGARQTGKSFIIRHICTNMFKNYVEINLADDKRGPELFARVKQNADFYLQISAIAGTKLGKFDDTIIFLDEIQEYPHLISMLKSLRNDGRYHYITSGSLLGITLRHDTFIPMGSITIMDMYPLDFEEFLIANSVGPDVIHYMRNQFEKREALTANIHATILDYFKKYLLVGGFPDDVNVFIESQNITVIRQQQQDIRRLYADDASKYDKEHKLHLRRIYGMIPSTMENKKKRMVFKDIEANKNKRFNDYADDFDYLIDSGITLDVKAISNPKFPLIESASKNLQKLYLNDVGLLSGILYGTNINAILNDQLGVNLGAVYETVVAQELKVHGNVLFYYDNKKNGEVDFLVDDYESLSVVPLEIKSGKDYAVHSSLSHFIKTPDYGIRFAYVLSNEPKVFTKECVTYMPIYYIMFFEAKKQENVILR
jgi:predicted AAA+ superfamily ATPase